ncbi:MAG: NAD(P)/FAD-dependent oxidoreductase, partial [Thermodesulfovibrio sp.]|nr:NAD(P)/FAD-dependent oxidoreductase [Thermodesulfovibrio sp.]
MNFEVLVVGGGPAGSTAANCLAKEGIATCLVERNLEFKKPCGGGVPSAGLKDLDILDEIRQKLTFNVVRRVKIIPPFSEPIEVKLNNGEILIFDRYEFDTFLRKLAFNNGVQIIEGELINLEEGKKIKATIKTKSGDLLKINSKYIVAADGINSKVCSLVNIKKPEFFWTVSFQISLDNYNNDYNKDTCEFWFGSSHASFFYSWVFPGKNYLSIGTGAKKVNMLKLFIENFIEKRFFSLLDISKIKLRAFKIPRWTKRNFYRKNIIL